MSSTCSPTLQSLAAEHGVRKHFPVTHTQLKLLAASSFNMLFVTPAYADVSYQGFYIAVTSTLVMLFLPVIIVALTHRARKKLYITVLTLWASAVFAYLWLAGGSETEFYLSLVLPYILLLVYLFKERQPGPVVE